MLTINYRDPRPIYEQIMDELRKMIISGVFAADEKLPSVRELAQQLASLALALLLAGEVAGVAYVGDDAQLKGGVVRGACEVVVDGACEVGIVGLADSKEEGFHSSEFIVHSS